MAVQFTQLPGEPIHVFSIAPPAEPSADVLRIQKYIASAARSTTGKLYVLADFSQASITFSDLVVGMAELARNILLNTGGPQLETALVGTSDLVRLFSSATTQSQYGGKHMPAFTTSDEALAHLRSLIAAE